MNEILHRVIIECAPEALYGALATEDGLAGWWTRAESASTDKAIVRFLFGPAGDHVVEMKILQQVPNEKVTWQCTAGPWVDTGEFSFGIQAHERGSVLKFAHRGWPESGDFYQHCNAKWGFFLGVSLKHFLETGRGQPHPEDPDF